MPYPDAVDLGCCACSRRQSIRSRDSKPKFWPLLTSMEAVGLCWTCLGL